MAVEPNTQPITNAQSKEGQETPGLAQVAFEEVVQPLAIAVLLGCLVYAIAQFILKLSPDWPVIVHVMLSVLVAADSIHSWRLLERQDMVLINRLRFRFVEWVVIALVARFAVYIPLGGQRLISDMAHWSIEIVSFFDLGYVAIMLTTIAVWIMARALARAFGDLQAQPIEKRPALTEPGSYLYETMPHHGRTDRQAILRRITGVLFGVGILMVLISGLARVDAGEMIHLQHQRSEGVIANVLIYFLVAFLLTSQARYALLKASWQLSDIPMLGDIGKRWAILAMLFLALVGIVAALLPVDYSVGIIDVLSTALQWVIYVLLQIVFLILYIFSVLFSLVARLFGQQDAPPPQRQQAVEPAPIIEETAQGIPWWPLVRSLIFWTVAIGIIGYSLYYFIGYRSKMFRNLSLRKLFRWLRTKLGSAWSAVSGASRQVATTIREEIGRRLAARRHRGTSRWRYVSLRRMTPRDRVRYFYLSVLHRAQKQGFGRQPTLTPLEYEALLGEQLADAEISVRELTEAFVEARYSEHNVDQQGATLAQRAWQRIKRALTTRRRVSQHDARND